MFGPVHKYNGNPNKETFIVNLISDMFACQLDRFTFKGDSVYELVDCVKVHSHTRGYSGY